MVYELAWVPILDIGEGSIFVNSQVLCSVFTDDYTFGGPPDEMGRGYFFPIRAGGFDFNSLNRLLLGSYLESGGFDHTNR